MLLNRCITRAHSISDARQALQDLGYDVLATAVPRLEVYAQSFGLPIPDTGRDLWRQVVRDLIERCTPPSPIRSLTPRHHRSNPPRRKCHPDQHGPVGRLRHPPVRVIPGHGAGRYRRAG